MLVKIKAFNALTANILNEDTSIFEVSITRNGAKSVFEIGSNISISLYDFETINSVDIVVENTSTYVITEDVSNLPTRQGIITVTSESGNVTVYNYVIEELTYLSGLPVITTAQYGPLNVDCNVIAPTQTTITGTVLNIGSLVNADGLDVNTLAAQDSTIEFLDNVVGNYDAVEAQKLWDGVTKYWKIYHTSKSPTDYEFVLYMKEVNNVGYTPPAAPAGTAVSIPYANQIGLWLHETFIPWFDGIEANLEDIYTTSDDTDLSALLGTLNITSYNALWSDVDTTWLPFETETAENFNSSSNPVSFVHSEIFNMREVIASHILERLDATINSDWTAYKADNSLTFSSLIDEVAAIEDFREEWLQTRNIEAAYDYLKYVRSGLDEDSVIVDSVNGTNKADYIVGLIKRGPQEMTYDFLTTYLTQNDYLFIEARLGYMKTQKTLYSISTTENEFDQMINLFNVLIHGATNATLILPAPFNATTSTLLFAEKLTNLIAVQ